MDECREEGEATIASIGMLMVHRLAAVRTLEEYLSEREADFEAWVIARSGEARRDRREALIEGVMAREWLHWSAFQPL